MSDTMRARLAEILYKRGAYCGDCDYESRCPDCDKVLAGYADVILAEFLVIPRSEITGTEYGYRHVLDNGEVCEHPVGSRETALTCARSCPMGESPEALERPVPPWSVIPLPEDGDNRCSTT